MTPHEIEGLIEVGTVVIVTLTITKALVSRFLGPRSRSQQIAPPDSERMERLERAVESIAMEVERISEGQRFVTKVLSDNPNRLEKPDQAKLRAP